MSTDQLADLLTRVRNAQTAGHPTVTMPASKTKQRVLDVLLQEGYIEAVQQTKGADEKAALKVVLKYVDGKTPAIQEIRRLSRPGKRQYVGCDEIPLVRSGLGVIVVSTSKGMMSDRAARHQGLGGELICSVF